TDSIYLNFLERFHERLHIDPLTLTLVLAALFYSYAAIRRAPAAMMGLAGSLAILAFVGPGSTLTGARGPTQPLFLIAAGLVSLFAAILRRSSWRALAGALLMLAAANLVEPAPSRGAVLMHLSVFAFAVLGAAFDDRLAEFLRGLAAILILAFGLRVLTG